MSPRRKAEPLIGAHMSIAGGVHNAIDQAVEVDATALQIFTKNNNQWVGKPLGDKNIAKFEEKLAESAILAVVGHTAYLINLASPREEIYRKSVDALKDELERADRLGLSDLVMHPGAHLESGEDVGIEKIAETVNRIFDKLPDNRTRLSLEVTAGQGTSIGHKFEHIAEIIEKIEDRERLSVCFDTCHAFAAGYELRTKRDFNATFKAFDDTIGLEYLKVFHVNDSKKPLGSRVDRHHNLGDGELGLEPFKFLMQDKRFRDIPKILETPKGDNPAKNDRMNLDILRGFAK